MLLIGALMLQEHTQLSRCRDSLSRSISLMWTETTLFLSCCNRQRTECGTRYACLVRMRKKVYRPCVLREVLRNRKITMDNDCAKAVLTPLTISVTVAKLTVGKHAEFHAMRNVQTEAVEV